jgi:peptide/nickel transport system substrate-binding protein
MGPQLRRLSIAFVAVVAACAPVAAGPELPRPALPAGSAPLTTAPPTTVVTHSVTTALSQDPTCPTEFCVLYTIDPDAVWSDGTPVTGDDFVRTYQQGRFAGIAGYDRIVSVEMIEPKQVFVVFAGAYGAWPQLFARLVGQGSAQTTGYELVDQVPGDSIVVSRVANWWPAQDPVSGAVLGDVTQVTFVFMSDLDEMVEALAAGDVDVIVGRPDPGSLEDLREIEGVAVSVVPGPYWEQISFHHEDPALAQPWVRMAIAMAIDREALLDATARQVQPDAIGLDNTIFMSRTRPYEDHYDIAHDPAGAEQLLVDNGCVRGEDGTYECGGNRLSFRWATTTDDPARREAFTLIEADLASIGIELVPDFRTPSAFVATDFLFGGPERWQLANFSWRVGDDPGENADLYRCGESLLNLNRYCSPGVASLVDQAAATLDRAVREDLYNQADALFLGDLAVIPLYQKPELMAWRETIQGPIHNHSRSSDLWNLASWTGQEAIVVAIPAEPTSLDPFVTTDDEANMVLATLLYGAFAMDPAYETLPVLVDSARVIEG